MMMMKDDFFGFLQCVGCVMCLGWLCKEGSEQEERRGTLSSCNATVRVCMLATARIVCQLPLRELLPAMTRVSISAFDVKHHDRMII